MTQIQKRIENIEKKAGVKDDDLPGRIEITDPQGVVGGVIEVKNRFEKNCQAKEKIYEYER